MKEETINRRIEQLKDLPTLPTILMECNQMLQNPETTASTLGDVIKTDQAISSKVLKLVNSAFYGLSGRVSTISQAIVVLGFNAVRNIILSISVFEFLPRNADLKGFEIYKFWEHSIGCGVISKILGQKLGIEDPEEAFIAGLLHDVGKLVIARIFPEDFITILKITHSNKALFLDAEQDVLGITHNQTGEILAKHWRLPSTLIESIAFHHNGTEKMNNKNLVSIVHLADIITRGLQIGSGGDMVIPAINRKAWDALNMNSKIIEPLMDDLDEELEKMSIFLSIISE
ncbi:MAG: HDOD domain-containing protein [Syntrophaceae bacterium]|nr:HDOD domain-containing protein [Syntrophaceae bacterium]